MDERNPCTTYTWFSYSPIQNTWRIFGSAIVYFVLRGHFIPGEKCIIYVGPRWRNGLVEKLEEKMDGFFCFSHYIFCILYLISDILHLISDIWHFVSYILYFISDILYNIFCILYLTSDILHLTSDILYNIFYIMYCIVFWIFKVRLFRKFWKVRIFRVWIFWIVRKF